MRWRDVLDWRPNLRLQLALVVAAAVVPMATAMIAEAAMGGRVEPPGRLGMALGIAVVSGALAWRVGAVGILGPILRLCRSLAGASGHDPIGEIARAVEGLTSEVGLRRDEAASAALARLAAEEALHHNMDVLRSMVSTLPVGVVAIGRDGCIKLWNHAAETILGYTSEEMVGRPTPPDIFSPAPECGATAADVFLRMVTGQRVKGEEVRCLRKDGSLVDASFSGAPLMDEDERLRGAICVFEDVGQRNAIAEQLQQAQKMEAVGQLTGGLAHDFNNILGVAIGNLDLLEVELADRPDAIDMIDTALGALLRGAELTRALLAFSRRQPLQPALVDVAELLGVVGRMLSRTLGEHIRIALSADGGLWRVLADAAQLEAAITNLAINARDAMPSGGRLTVTARNASLDESYASRNAEVEPGDYLVIEISDTGSGMTPEVLARVYEPFFTTKPVGQGTGLGLSMVYGFIKQSGGHIRIYSEVGHGTTVRLYLPRAKEAAGKAGAKAAPEPVPGGSETVLVVEDNAEVRRMVSAQLGKLGYGIISAAHGPAAMDVLSSNAAIDLLFTDVVMPEGMTGFELAEAALKMRPGLKVLVTSGFPGTTFHPPDGADGAMDFISKPYRRQDLARAVRAVLDGKGSKK